MFAVIILKIGPYAQGAKCIDLQGLITAEFVSGALDEWTTIALGLITALEKEIKNIFSSFYFTLDY